MTRRKKNNIIIGSLLAVVLLMAVGYAAFSSVLNIQGTGSINSSWNIRITNVEVSNIVGDASDGEGTTYQDLTATINSNLVSPGDSITYDVTVRNDGNIDAVLTDINLTESTNPAISFSTSNLTEGTELGQGEEAILKVTITYNNSVTSQPEDTSADLNVTLTYEQKGSGSVTPSPSGPTIGGQDVEVVSSGDGLYEDSYEAGRYVYKGANPDNYITFNDETWRIVAKETDGTIKIMRNESIGNRAWDTNSSSSSRNNSNNTYCQISSGTYSGCNAWGAVDGTFTDGNKSGTVTQDSTLNTYLNGTYYNGLDSSVKDNIVSHTWGIGPVTADNDDLATQIESENGTTWSGNIGLIAHSDYLRANSDMTNCGTDKTNYENYETCRNTDWMYISGTYWWTISPYAGNSSRVWYVIGDGALSSSSARSELGVRPAVYLSSNLTLTGSGTQSDPYVPAG